MWTDYTLRALIALSLLLALTSSISLVHASRNTKQISAIQADVETLSVNMNKLLVLHGLEPAAR